MNYPETYEAGQLFLRLVIAFVDLDESDPKRPTWEQVDQAQQKFLELSGLRTVKVD